MTTDNTEIDQELDEVTLDNNANEEQAIAEELSVEEQMALDLANEKDKYLRLFAEFKITNVEQLRSVLSYSKRPIKKFYLPCFLY